MTERIKRKKLHNSVREKGRHVWERILGVFTALVLFCSVPAIAFASNPLSIDMSGMIQSARAEYRSGADDPWKPLTDGLQIHDGDEIRCSISYVVPGNSLSAGNDTIHYQMPTELLPDTVEKGIVTNSDGVEVGTYTIDTKGTISIRFNPDYVESNAHGQPIRGKISFYATADKSKLGDDGILDLPFSDDCNISVQVVDKQVTAGDIHLSKSAVKLGNGKIRYRMEVRSAEGTFGPVTVRDQMSHMVYAGNLTVTQADGRPVSFSPVPNPGDSSFALQLPPMKPGEQYNITYDAVSDSKNPASAVKNEAVAQSENSVGKPISASAKVETKLESVRKEGHYDPASKTITWTIRVNEQKLNISGWKLRDFITTNVSQEYFGKARITDSAGNSKEISLPYLFPDGSCDTYVITFETPAEYFTMGENQVKNDVSLVNGSQLQDNATAGVVIGRYDAAKKQGGKPRREEGRVIIPWTVQLDFTAENLDELLRPQFHVWDLLDQANGKQYFTVEQLQAFRTQATAAFAAEEVTVNEASWEVITPDGLHIKWQEAINRGGHYFGFDFTVPRSQAQGKRLTLQYETTGLVPDPTAVVSFKNMFVLDDSFTNATVTVSPEEFILDKYDPAFPGADVSEHDWLTLPNGSLVWKIRLYVPRSRRGETVYLTEQLPANVTVTSLRIMAGKSSWQYAEWYWQGTDTARPGWFDVNQNREVKATIHRDPGNRYRIELPPELHTFTGDHFYEFYVEVKLNDDQIMWTNDGGALSKAPYANTFTILDGENTMSDTQTQVVTKDALLGVVKKSGVQAQDSNIVHYSVTVNPEGLDLMKTSDTLQIRDELRHSTSPDDFRTNLVPDSVIVYERKQDGTRGRQVEAPYTYEQKDDSLTHEHVHVLRIVIPDQTPLIVTYQYRFSGKTSSAADVKNGVRLEGVDEEHNHDDLVLHVEIQNSGAIADVQGISFYKVDAADNGIYLSGAKFRLFRWNGAQSRYEAVMDKNGSDCFVTDKRGKIAITTEHVAGLSYNTAYRLVEIEAPTGYFINEKPFDFCIVHKDQTAFPMTLPPNFAGRYLADGDTVYFGDTCRLIDLNVIKIWHDETGATLKNPPVSEVKIHLYQQTESGEKTLYGSYVLKASEHWRLKITGLPAAKRNEDGTRNELYFYTVEEEPVPGFKVSYSSDSGVNSGELGIINQKLNGYLLPETGGTGIFPYVLSGILCLTAAALLWVKRRSCHE